MNEELIGEEWQGEEWLGEEWLGAPPSPIRVFCESVKVGY
jgi:hypothetical protein